MLDISMYYTCIYILHVVYILYLYLGTNRTSRKTWRGRAAWRTRTPGTPGMSITLSLSNLCMKKHSKKECRNPIFAILLLYFYFILPVWFLLFSHVSIFRDHVDLKEIVDDQ